MTPSAPRDRRRSLACGLLALCLAAPAAAQPAESPAAGTWAGEIRTGAGETEVRVELRRAGSGWTGTLTMPDRQADGAELQVVSVTREGIRFSTPYVVGAPAFTGALSADGSKIEGTAELDEPPPPPGSDIYLFDLAVEGSTWRLGPGDNVTDRDGYDNQPRFLADGGGFLYTSIRDGQADVYRYDLDDGAGVRVTSTAESEYSPTPLPSGEGFSTVRVEEGDVQRLWKFAADGGRPELLLPDLEPVGYHGWLDDSRLALFVLGEPPTLVLASVGGATESVAESIGRSIHATPDGKAVSFVHKAADDDWRIELIELDGGARRTVAPTRPGSEDFIWTPDGRILMGEGSALWVLSPEDAAPSWRQVAELSTRGVAGITRLAMSPDGTHLAVVGERPAGDVSPARERHPFELRRLPETEE